MDRLTERTGEGQAIPRMDLKNNGHQRCVERLAKYEDLEEQGKLLIMAFEICVVSECTHCNYVQRRIEETWIRPELLNHDGFYETREEAEAALNEIGERMGSGAKKARRRK